MQLLPEYDLNNIDNESQFKAINRKLRKIKVKWEKIYILSTTTENGDQHDCFCKILNVFDFKLDRKRDIWEGPGLEIYRNQSNFFYDNVLQKPDFVCIEACNSHKPNYCSCFFELQLPKTTTAKIDDEHKVRAIDYNKKLLNALPLRESVTSGVTNMIDLILIKSIRHCVNNRISFKHEESRPIPFWTHGVSFLYQMLKDYSSVDYHPNNNVKLDISLDP
jgi:hypothetical protein